MNIETDVNAEFGIWAVDGHPRLIEFPRSFWDEILPAVMADFLRVPWGGPEIGGVLFGRREPDGVRIRAFRPLECEHVFGPAFHLSEVDQSRLRDVSERAKTDWELAGLEAVGWYHSKPHWLVLTPYDTELWDRYFPEPWQVAMGFLRARSKPCLVGLFYRREDGSVASSHREFNVIEAKPEASLPPPEREPQAEVHLEPAPEPEPEPEPEPAPEPEPEPQPQPAPEAARKAAPIAQPRTCCAYWGLSEMPFSPWASPCWNPQHEEVLSRLMRAVRGRKGLMVLTGEAGSGKTTFLGHLGDALAQESMEFALLLDPRLTVEEFYEFLADDLRLQCTRQTKVAVLKALQELLIQQARRDKTGVLVVDDAHHLRWEVLEEIRMLDNLQHRTGRLLQTILCGTPGIDRRLESEDCRQLSQRVALRCGLQPLREAEEAACIESQLAGCGMPDQTVFTPELLSAIHARSGGILRVTGKICSGLLELCFARESRVATLEMLDEVMRLE